MKNRKRTDEKGTRRDPKSPQQFKRVQPNSSQFKPEILSQVPRPSEPRPHPPSPTADTDTNDQIGDRAPMRAKGKIAHLPKEKRDLINRMLDDGATYKMVQHEIAKHGVSLNLQNISNWFTGPYKDHLRHQEWITELRSARESAADLDELSSTPGFQANLLQLAMTEIFRALHEGQSKSDSPGYIRLFNTLARLSCEALALRKYEDTHARKHAPLFTQSHPNCGPADEH